MSKYAVVIDSAGPNYCAYVPDLPGCVSAGYTLEEVTANIQEAIAIHIESLIEHGEEVPPISTPFAVEIGGTWLAASAQRSGINTEAKFLLLRHAFEVWRVARVDLKTDNCNERSKAAIARIGASFEGVLRQWQPSQVVGEEIRYRDSAMFSIIDAEWPALRLRFESLMEPPDGGHRVVTSRLG